jgi:hypothetical protein
MYPSRDLHALDPQRAKLYDRTDTYASSRRGRGRNFLALSREMSYLEGMAELAGPGEIWR